MTLKLVCTVLNAMSICVWVLVLKGTIHWSTTNISNVSFFHQIDCVANIFLH